MTTCLDHNKQAKHKSQKHQENTFENRGHTDIQSKRTHGALLLSHFLEIEKLGSTWGLGSFSAIFNKRELNQGACPVIFWNHFRVSMAARLNKLVNFASKSINGKKYG